MVEGFLTLKACAYFGVSDGILSGNKTSYASQAADK
jgi:hypothetical protein